MLKIYLKEASRQAGTLKEVFYVGRIQQQADAGDEDR